ncbi:MAG: aminotransferase class V-fold PLP-dependent enzyme [Bradymonadaceae bacterium]
MNIDWSPHWRLDFTITYLNHGSFGACPSRVLNHQQDLRDQMEREPVRFFVRELPSLLERARAESADFVGANPKNFAFVPNATTGVNAVLRSLELQPDDELLTTDHAYGACKNALDYVAHKAGARVVVAPLPFPLTSSDEIVDAVLGAVTPKTKLALLDHITSPTALILPVARLIEELERLGVDTLIDGAHAPGMIPLQVDSLGATYYTGNFHKWTCAPKGAAFLHVRDDRLNEVRPLAISHGATFAAPNRSRFHLEFDWTGTDDFTPYLCVPEAIRFMRSLIPGGWPTIMYRNHELATQARLLLADRLGLTLPCPTDLLGSMAALPLSNGDPEALQDALFKDHGIEVPIIPWPTPQSRLLRVSAQLYNTLEHYEALADALSHI